MSSVPETERDLRAVFAVELDERRYRAALDRTLRALDEEIGDHAARARRRRPLLTSRRGRRVVVLGLAAVLIVAAGALASDELRRIVFGSPDKPANQVKRFQEPGPPDVGLSSLGEPVDPDQHVAQAVASLRGFDTTEWGAPLFEYTRVLLEGKSNGVPFRIAAVPTDTGNVCMAQVVDPVATASCAERLDDTHPARFGMSRAGGRRSIVGLVADDVRGVTIVLEDGRREAAVFGPNAFGWVGDEAPAYVLIHRADSPDVRMLPDGSLA